MIRPWRRCVAIGSSVRASTELPRRVLVSLLAVALGGGARLARAHAPGEGAAPASSDRARLSIVVLDVATIDAALEDELAMRLRGRTTQRSDTIVDAPDARFAWLGVGMQGDAHARLDVVLSDGRAYARTIDAPPGQLRRAIAGAVANMLDAIEDGTLPVARTGVPMPLPQQPAPRPAPAPAPAPTPVAPIVSAGPPAATTPAAVRSRWCPPARWCVGPVVGGTAILGVGAPSAQQGFVAAGAALGLDAQHERGASFAVELRTAARVAPAATLVRTRVAIAAGWTVVRRRFQLPLQLGASVEPLVVRRDGGVASLDDATGRAARPRPLLGALVRAMPSLVFWHARRTAALRVGLQVELAGSFEARDHGGAVRLLGPDGAVHRAGALELGFGAFLGGAFAVRPAARRRAR